MPLSYFWGEVKNKKGDTVVARFTTSDGYDLTAWGTVEVAHHLLQDHNHKGYYTPSILIGKKLMDNMINKRIYLEATKGK